MGATVTLDRKGLIKALALIAPAVARKTHIPAILNYKLTANGTTRLSVTDLELTATYTFPTKPRGGKVAVLLPLGMFSAYLHRSAELTVVIAEADKGARLDGKLTVKALAELADFPAMPTELEQPKETFRLNALDFARAWRMVEIAVCTEVVRYALTGVLIDVDGKGRACVVSSDGKRLMRTRIKAKGVKSRTILPVKAATILAGMAAKAEPDRELVFAMAETTFEAWSSTGEARIAGRPIDGNFPDYDAVTPNDRDKCYVLDRKELLAAVEQVALATTDKTRAMRFSCSAKECKLFSRTVDVGEASMTVPCEGRQAWQQGQPEPVEVVLNPEYVADYLKAEDAETVELWLKDRTSAAVWTPSEKRDVTKYVCMPLTLKDYGTENPPQ